MAENYLTSLREAIDLRGPGADRDDLVSKYCNGLTLSYRNTDTQADPAAAAVFLPTADYSPCT